MSNEINKEMLDTYYKKPSIWECVEFDITKVKMITGKKIEFVDLTEYYDKPEHALELERDKMFMKGHFYWCIEQLKNELEREPSFSDYHCLYIKLLKELTELVFDYISPTFEMESRDSTIYEVMYAHGKAELKLDSFFEEYTANLETSADMAIKNFPDKTTQKEKNILNHLANNYLIKGELSQNKFPLFIKSGTQSLIKTLYKYVPEYTDFNAFNFLRAYIETNLPNATIENYCRIVKYDMPDRRNKYNGL
jgi:hypothetical protein